MLLPEIVAVNSVMNSERLSVAANPLLRVATIPLWGFLTTLTRGSVAAKSSAICSVSSVDRHRKGWLQVAHALGENALDSRC